MKKIEIIPIARKKLEQRGISEEWIRETINFPDQIVSGYNGRKVTHKKYMIENKDMIVVTAYLTPQKDRYRKEKENED